MAGLIAVATGVSVIPLGAESGYEAWLRYQPLAPAVRRQYDSFPASILMLGTSPVIASAGSEVIHGVGGMLGRTLRAEQSMPKEPAVILGTLESLRMLAPEVRLDSNLRADGFIIASRRIRGFRCLLVAGSTERGVLYGAFALLGRIARGETQASSDIRAQPYNAIRWVDQWDNLDGTIERGYAGPSIFFDKGRVRNDLTRVRDYARLLASVGINGCNVNNVNADRHVLDDDFLDQIAHIADVFRPWGIRMSISVDLSTPLAAGLDSFDPLDPRVGSWWQKKVEEVYARIPDFGGFTVKADSEGRPGPSTYGRTPADSANVIARMLKAHGGLLFYRAFVYDHHLDWHDRKADRAKAAVEIFQPLDGKFDDNVVIQIKHGPIDFQVREPASPLFADLHQTNEAIELQITQEYLGQQRHMVYLGPMWKEVLDFDMQANGTYAPVRDIVAGRGFHSATGGFVGVANVGMNEFWLGHPLAMSNLYAFGRLAWDPTLSTAVIARDWTKLTFGPDLLVGRMIPAMLMSSWRTYESYTGVLGLQTLTDITGSHYGPGIESAERNGWGQWFRAEQNAIGMDRTVSTGTGFVSQYPFPVARMYESTETTPDDLILFFHHLPYTYRLRSGKTIAQYIYDSHYQGAMRAAAYVEQWKTLRGHIDGHRYRLVLSFLEYQAGHAIVWRDAVCEWFLRISGIPDEKGRAGHHPDRIEAEAMQLGRGFTEVAIAPPENASGGKAVQCMAQQCTARFRFQGRGGWYEVDVQYFDMPGGSARFQLLVNSQMVDQWTADDRLPARTLGGDSATRRWVHGVALRPGDELRVVAIPDGLDPAALDYIEIRPEKHVDARNRH
ncbi:MAG: glucosiduronase [Acidobacteria bacterium]|nr:glucosiduronase [Acidobacteriota bacterium]